MIDSLKRRLDLIEEQKAEVIARVGALTEAARTRRPSPQEWSPQEIIEHLVLYEELMSGWIAAAERAPDEKKRRRRLPSPFVPIVTRIMYWSIRVPTLPELLPRNDASLDELKQRWAEARATFTSRLETIRPEQVHEAIALHPIAGPLDTTEALRLAESHLVYHQRQIARQATRRGAA